MSPGPNPPAKTVLPGEKPKGESLLSRRAFVRNTVRLAVAGAILPGALSQVLPAIAPNAIGGAGAGPVIRRENGRKIPLTIADLKPQPGNDPLVGEWGFLPATIYMVKKTVLEASSAYQKINTAQFAVQHPEDDAYAILVYRTKCKHLGCTVGWNGKLGTAPGGVAKEDYDGDTIPEGRILCPCHQGQYDIYNLARNIPGTPPPAPLDIIRIRVGNYTDPDGKIESAANAIIGAEVLPQAKYKDADMDSKAGKTTYALGSQAAPEA